MNQTNFLKRHCPICNKKGKYKILIKTEKRAEQTPFKNLAVYWNGFFKEKIIFSYARCKACGLLFCPTFFTEKQLNILYAQMAPNMDEVPKKAIKNTQYGYFTTLKNHSALRGDYLEIGPDVGFFVENTVREGFFDRYWLFEPNRSAVTSLSQIVKGKKFKIIHEMTDFSMLPNHSVSTVVMIHVMDHLLDPVATLSELRRKLTSDARLLIVTHDESSLLRRIFGWKWPAFCLQHPQIYNFKTTSILLQEAGFNVIQQHKTINYFKLNFLVKHFLWAIGLRVKRVPSFGNVIIGLKLGNILTIAEPNRRKRI